jgi:hypothetical protein
MKLLSQLDPQWAKDKLGASSLTVGRWGCTTTCIAMASDYFGCYKSPKEIAHNASNYTQDGNIVWERLRFEKMRFVKRVRKYDASVEKEVREILADPNRAVLITVNNDAHWVLAYSTKMFSNDIAIADPLGGKITSLKKAKYTPSGISVFERIDAPLPAPKPTPVPEKPSKKLIKSTSVPDIFFYNGESKFLIPDWPTFVELFGNQGMGAVELLPQEVVAAVPNGRTFPSLAVEKK